ncbi:MAG: proton-conducting transporter membrane subunit, partial [Candidatus Omnitrophica bacterium]|nr:proton-conducting transporter membrane subunit [Candidatus Omnitrophota bacterium]
LNSLGGLAKAMPITYISCLIASLSISGIPPFNGFVSKWLIYQGLIQGIQGQGSKLQELLVLFCLAAAMFGSGLTLASFMKLLHAMFLGQAITTSKARGIKEVPWTMWGPCVILAAICILFGVFAFNMPLKHFIFPVVSAYMPVGKATLLGIWSPKLASVLVVIGLVFGCVIFKSSRLSLRQDGAYSGSETRDLNEEENLVMGTEFYDTVKEIGWLRRFYMRSEKGLLDIYEGGKKIFYVSGIFQRLHNGVLPTYKVWILLGMLGLFFALLK